MRVLHIRASRKANSLMAFGEFYREESDQCLHIIVAHNFKSKIRVERQVFYLNRIQIDVL